MTRGRGTAARFYGTEATRERTARARPGQGGSILRYGSDMRVHLGFFPSVP